MQPRLLLAGAALASLVGSACSDPVRSGKIDALGGETPGIPAGPLHRGGQPCLVCHDGNGPGGGNFSFAGTVYEDQKHARPISDVIVRLIDVKNHQYEAATNCAGNFFVMKADYNPEFPVWVRLQFGESGGMPLPAVPMGTPIYREGSCATCHVDLAGTDSAGRVFLAPVPINAPNAGCQ
jgi:hypothetical protein